MLSCRFAPAVLLFASMPSFADEGDFRATVAPILETRCVRCHGGESSKGGLKLTSAQAALAGGKSGPAITPGKPEESLLLEMITGDKPKMPQNAAPLSAEQVAALKQWIAEGAKWPADVVLKDRRFDGEVWWSLKPLLRPVIPVVKDAGWVRTPIDAFILRQLEDKGLSPRPEADRPTLLRRLTFDLHGLPPTPEEIDSFRNDARSDAYERLVDRLLASPRYGERWGRHWLDVAHYGDTHGYDKDKRRNNAWPYRDYVIRSLNADKPYARFIREQLAGDVLFPHDPDGIIATGFIAAGPWDFVGHVELREGTVDKLKTRLIDRDDMLANAMSTFVSLTVHCARCHDHKFDPIPQADYYRLQAVFAGVDRGDRPYPDGRTSERTALEQRRQELRAAQAAWQKRVTALASPELARLDEELRDGKKQLAELPAAPMAPSPTNGYHSAIMPTPDHVKWVQLDLGRSVAIDEIRLIPARPTDFPDTPGFGFPLRFKVEIADEPSFQPARIVADHTGEDFAPPGNNPVAFRPGQRGRYVRVTATRLWPRTNDYTFALAEMQVTSAGVNVAARASVTAHDSIEAGRWSTKHLVDGFDSRSKLPDRSDPKTAELLGRRRTLEERLQQGERRRVALVESLMDDGLKTERKRTAEDLAFVEQVFKALPPPAQVYATVPHAPRPIQVLQRGDVEQPGAEAKPGALSAVAGLAHEFPLADPQNEGSRRAALAEWVVHPNNVLTWRSIVNRVWHYHFGRGLVDTPNDFGRNGTRPTHPELLDWLAVEFRTSGESLKQLHRLIVTSAAYRQASTSHPAYALVDADNRWLWRMNRQRLDAESIRDAVLAVSGQLDARMGGPGFEQFRFKDDHSPVYDHLALEKVHDPATYRRTVYRFVVRSVPSPFLDCLDSADPNVNTPVRNTTLTALQALALLNDPFMVRQAEFFAARLQKQSSALTEQLGTAFVLAFGRPPRPEESEALSVYARRHGLANACRLLFNANEFVFID